MCSPLSCSRLHVYRRKRLLKTLPRKYASKRSLFAMTRVHPFRFSAVIDQIRPQKSQSLLYADEQFSHNAPAHQVWSREGLVAKAHWVEDLGYTTLLVPDHPWLHVAPLSALMLVAATTSLPIGTYSLILDVSHPPPLPNSLSTTVLL